MVFSFSLIAGEGIEILKRPVNIVSTGSDLSVCSQHALLEVCFLTPGRFKAKESGLTEQRMMGYELWV